MLRARRGDDGSRRAVAGRTVTLKVAEAAAIEPLLQRVRDRGGFEKVKQRTRTDCGIAVLAWLTGVTWLEARNAIFGDELRLSYRTNATGRYGVQGGLSRLGYAFGPLCKTADWAKLQSYAEGYAAVWATTSSGGRSRHWVAWHRPSTDGALAAEHNPIILFDPHDGLLFSAASATRRGIALRSSFTVRKVELA